MRMDRIRDMRSRGMRDGRNPYGSRGGYVVSHRRRDYGRMDDYVRNPEYDSRYSDMSSQRQMFERDGHYGKRDYEYDRDYDNVRRVGSFEYDTYYDGRDYGQSEYFLSSRELKEWAKDLMDEVKPEHRTTFDRANFETRARELGLDNKEYTLDELYVATLMAETDYGETLSKYGANKLDTMICMGKDFLIDPDSDLRYGEKLASYYFNVVCVD